MRLMRRMRRMGFMLANLFACRCIGTNGIEKDRTGLGRRHPNVGSRRCRVGRCGCRGIVRSQGHPRTRSDNGTSDAAFNELQES